MNVIITCTNCNFEIVWQDPPGGIDGALAYYEEWNYKHSHLMTCVHNYKAYEVNGAVLV